MTTDFSSTGLPSTVPGHNCGSWSSAVSTSLIYKYCTLINLTIHPPMLITITINIKRIRLSRKPLSHCLPSNSYNSDRPSRPDSFLVEPSPRIFCLLFRRDGCTQYVAFFRSPAFLLLPYFWKNQVATDTRVKSQNSVCRQARLPCFYSFQVDRAWYYYIALLRCLLCNL